VVVNWQNFLLYLLTKVFLILLFLLNLCILMCEDLLLYLPKEVLDIMSLSVMIYLFHLDLSYETSVWYSHNFQKFWCSSKDPTLYYHKNLSLWLRGGGVNTLLMSLTFYLPLMELYIKPLALTFFNKMMLLKENIVILLRLQDHSCYLLMFQVSSWGKLFLQNLMLWIRFQLHIILVCLLLKNCMVMHLITLLCVFLDVLVLF